MITHNNPTASNPRHIWEQMPMRKRNMLANELRSMMRLELRVIQRGVEQPSNLRRKLYDMAHAYRNWHVQGGAVTPDESHARREYAYLGDLAMISDVRIIEPVYNTDKYAPDKPFGNEVPLFMYLCTIEQYARNGESCSTSFSMIAHDITWASDVAVVMYRAGMIPNIGLGTIWDAYDVIRMRSGWTFWTAFEYMGDLDRWSGVTCAMRDEQQYHQIHMLAEHRVAKEFGECTSPVSRAITVAETLNNMVGWPYADLVMTVTYSEFNEPA